MLALFCGFFRCFRLFGGFFEANWFLTLIAFDKKDSAVPMQSGVRVFGRAKTNYIIKARVYETIYNISILQKSSKKEQWTTSLRWLTLYAFGVILQERKVELAH